MSYEMFYVSRLFCKKKKYFKRVIKDVFVRMKKVLTIISNNLIRVMAPAIPMIATTTAKSPRDTPNPARAFTRLPILKDPMEMFSSNGIY